MLTRCNSQKSTFAQTTSSTRQYTYGDCRNIHLAEYDVLAVQPRRGNGAYEELRSVSVPSGVGHGQHSRLVVLDFGLLKDTHRSTPITI